MVQTVGHAMMEAMVARRRQDRVSSLRRYCFPATPSPLRALYLAQQHRHGLVSLVPFLCLCPDHSLHPAFPASPQMRRQARLAQGPCRACKWLARHSRPHCRLHHHSSQHPLRHLSPLCPALLLVLALEVFPAPALVQPAPALPFPLQEC
jgi:hypothetical protein